MHLIDMKIITIVLFYTLLSTSILAQNLSVTDQKNVNKFVDAVKSRNKEKISDLVSYPLSREYPVPEIKNKQELLRRFYEVFDNKLLALISESNIQADWSDLGWRGIMFLNGEVWLNSSGQLIQVNHQTVVFKKKLEELIDAQRATLHPSLKQFVKPICVLETSRYRIRIDELKSGKYRYASWRLNQKMIEPPELIVENGEMIVEGSGGNHYYSFKKGEYTYNCGITIVGIADSPPAYLSVNKGDKEILYQKAKVIN